MTDIKIFVGCAPDGMDAESQCVLEYGLRSRSSLPIDLTWMHLSRDPSSMWYSDEGHGWDTRSWATVFSGLRWSVPAACDFSGRAIYMDSDTIVLGDIAELWRIDLSAHEVVAARSAGKFCISLWDCEAAREHIQPLHERNAHQWQSRYFAMRPQLVRSFGNEWNYLDTEDRGPFGKIVHYTDLRSQPSLRHAIPRLAGAGQSHWYDGPVREGRRDIAELFEREYCAARAAGYTVDRYIPEERFGPFRKRSMAGYGGKR